ncbi:flagellar basal body rod protein FlgG [Fictibacillus sp. KU28468]|uniref:flagellar basal body rod protein FlgG n=1 Tax=Fictibacillus sp. KU28468 TaxID=2991053 RepID=UPI00223DE21A|nr:flagellar basal body rod protein FlgG [Fictibacillus sp. KU28468]UZJ77161.1 flagellar basal body rod protein FlgG [Fictibacillus sp. KU28468]
MLRSMYSGISGMKNFQTKLDVIGNNIANVNTYGFKKGRTTFKDLVSQQISGAGAPGTNIGGTNPKQIGLGSQMAAIDTIDTQGSLQTTGRALDLGISGDGYFVVVNGNGDKFLTRAGNFYLDANGSIVNSDGFKLLDSAGTALKIPTDASSFSIGADGSITVVGGAGTNNPTNPIALAKIPNPAGLEKAGSNLYRVTKNSGNDTVALSKPGDSTKGVGSLVSGALEMSNVDLSEEFTEMIVAQRGFQANTKIITTSDEILQELVNLKR